MAAQDVQIDIVATALWPQGDARDPLGVWGGRAILTATGTEPMKVRFSPGESFAGAYVYTAYSALISGLNTFQLAALKCRLLTNWPDIDPLTVGVQGFGAINVSQNFGAATLTAPFDGPTQPMVQPQDRFILLFDPRPVAGAFDIVELEISVGVLDRNYAFECWGYYWDRQVLNTPGGPRHPGAQ